MSSQSYSSLGSKRRAHLHDDIDRSVYAVGQTLASIVNDPRTAHQTGGFWGLGQDASLPSQPPPLDPAKYPHVTKADVQRYIDLVHGAYDRFIRDRQSLEAFDAKHQPGSSDPRAGSNQGEPFMTAVQAVPMQFFQEGFFDNWDDFFKQYCKEQSADELYEQIDQLNRNLDVVELQLLREVASRSDSFFQAAASLQHLLGMLGDSVSSIRALRHTLATADEQMYSTAVSVKALQSRRSNLQATLDITKGLEEVMAAQQALDCMLEGQDYAGALELLEQMKQLLEQPALMGLQCVRHLPPRLLDTTAAVEAALANEFLNTIANGDIVRVVAQAAADAEAEPDAGVSVDGRGDTGAAWQLPSPTERTTTAAATTEQLQEKLLPLAIGLYRSERLLATMQQYKTRVGDEVKSAVRDVVQQVLPVLLAASGDMPPQQQQQGGQAGSETQLSDQLQLLHHGAFMVLLYAAARVIYSCVDHTVCVGQLLETILTGINTPASQLASLRKECAAALQVVVDVGLGRWVKLLAARSTAHTRLKQYELRQLLDLSEQVAAYTESLGARTLGSFRSALQSQCKALLDHSHARSMNQLQHLLESEQWVAVEVPGSFQDMLDRLVTRCGEGAALLDGRHHTPHIAAAAAAAAAAAGSSTTAAGDGGSSSGSSPAVSGDGSAAAAAGVDGAAERHSPTLQLCGKSFHLVNSGLMLLKMVDEYMSLYDLMPQFGAEIVHRELELLKLFNSQTCALVLGAGAMRTAGLRSISAKQLALSCQAVSMLATLLPLLRAGSLALVSQPRRALLMPEFDRLLQDLTMHMDEVHSKLVDIMRDRLAAATQALPGEIRHVTSTGNNSVMTEQPSPTISLLAKQLNTLRTVLVPFMLREEVEFVFGAVARAYSDALSDTFEALLAQDSSCEGVVRINALTMLQVFRDMPLDPTRINSYCSRLSTTYTKHFGLPPWDQEKLGHRVQQQQQQDAEQPAAQRHDEQQQPQQQHDEQRHQLVEGQQQQQQGGLQLQQRQRHQGQHEMRHSQEGQQELRQDSAAKQQAAPLPEQPAQAVGDHIQEQQQPDGSTLLSAYPAGPEQQLQQQDIAARAAEQDHAQLQPIAEKDVQQQVEQQQQRQGVAEQAPVSVPDPGSPADSSYEQQGQQQQAQQQQSDVQQQQQQPDAQQQQPQLTDLPDMASINKCPADVGQQGTLAQDSGGGKPEVAIDAADAAAVVADVAAEHLPEGAEDHIHPEQQQQDGMSSSTTSSMHPDQCHGSNCIPGQLDQAGLVHKAVGGAATAVPEVAMPDGAAVVAADVEPPGETTGTAAAAAAAADEAMHSNIADYSNMNGDASHSDTHETGSSSDGVTQRPDAAAAAAAVAAAAAAPNMVSAPLIAAGDPGRSLLDLSSPVAAAGDGTDRLLIDNAVHQQQQHLGGSEQQQQDSSVAEQQEPKRHELGQQQQQGLEGVGSKGMPTITASLPEAASADEGDLLHTIHDTAAAAAAAADMAAVNGVVPAADGSAGELEMPSPHTTKQAAPEVVAGPAAQPAREQAVDQPTFPAAQQPEFQETATSNAAAIAGDELPEAQPLAPQPAAKAGASQSSGRAEVTNTGAAAEAVTGADAGDVADLLGGWGVYDDVVMPSADGAATAANSNTDAAGSSAAEAGQQQQQQQALGSSSAAGDGGLIDLLWAGEQAVHQGSLQQNDATHVSLLQQQEQQLQQQHAPADIAEQHFEELSLLDSPTAATAAAVSAAADTGCAADGLVDAEQPAEQRLLGELPPRLSQPLFTTTWEPDGGSSASTAAVSSSSAELDTAPAVAAGLAAPVKLAAGGATIGHAGGTDTLMAVHGSSGVDTAPHLAASGSWDPLNAVPASSQPIPAARVEGMGPDEGARRSRFSQ